MSERIEALWRNMTADKKKFTLMVSLICVGLLLWGRLLLQKVPRTAMAEPAVAQVMEESSDNPTELKREAVTIAMVRSVTRDIFKADRGYYEIVGNAKKDDESEEKSPSEATDELDRQRQVQEALAGLRLQTTLMGDLPRAMINGELIRVGQSIGGFILREVQARKVTLEQDGIIVRLEM